MARLRTRLITLFIMTLTLLVGNPAFSADLQRGLAAYNKGNYATALKEWEPLAIQGNAEAQSNLGAMYAAGHGVSRSHKIAVKWYKLSAEQGYDVAQFNLGWAHHKGKGVPQNYKAAIKWYTLSAEQGYDRAQIGLGGMHYNGLGTLQDYPLAYMWWSFATSQGSEKAKVLLDVIALNMSPARLKTAQRLARECVRRTTRGAEMGRLAIIVTFIALSACVSPAVDISAPTFDKSQYTADLDTCRGGTAFNVALDDLAGAVYGSIIGTTW